MPLGDGLAGEEEKATVFSTTWQVVGHVHQAAEPGDYFTFDLIGEPLLIVRGDDGVLRGFYNVCRHRAGNPATDCGNRKLFRCGYHGWTYRLDGALLVTPEFDGVEDFDPKNFGLVPVRLEEWFNLIFVNLDPKARPLRESLGDMPVQAAKFDPQLSRVYVRHVNHQDYYPARASVTAQPPRIRPSVPTPKEIRA